MTSRNYNCFIEEAFIDPIRSVLIVDDDYPTYNDILNTAQGNKGSGYKKKGWFRNPNRIEKVIQSFRDRETPLLVDIHDGQNISTEDEIKAATHLHQCDLLVLDYQLDGGTQDGSRAIEILRRVMSNNHFNLVIIYTNKNLDIVFNDIRWGLIKPSDDQLPAQDVKAVKNLIHDGDDEIEGFHHRLYESIGPEEYFYSRQKSNNLRVKTNRQNSYRRYHDEVAKVGWTKRNRELVLRYLLNETERKNIVNDSSSSHIDNLEWSTGKSQASPKWIKSESAFVALSHKADEGKDLLAVLQNALNDWSPPPSQLFLTRLRAEIDEHGVVEQARSLNYKYALAYWYYRLLISKSNDDRRWLITESVSRHTEQILEAIQPQVVEFASRLIETEANTGAPVKICKEHFDVDLGKHEEEKNAILEHNAFVCSTEPTGAYLTTGHIFSISDEYWLCLSPACDMIPDQKKSHNKIYGTNHLPFVATKLQPLGNSTNALKNVHTNRYLFLRIKCDGHHEIRSYCFNSPQGVESSPHWHIFFAEKDGRLSQDFKFTVTRIKQGTRRLISERLPAEVVSQLRYEYALNLIQKLGVSLTRIGLDFIKHDPD